ncbi:MAG TPA: hypothetical protein VHA52_02405, partial [Candidatus Babeliaceae bacterium]|nr:hypothetical protein [Candidatus Babeliaceae bacterium]
DISKILADEIFKISGANEELMGAAIDDKAGILSMLRQGAGLTTLQPLFDNLDYAQKLLGQRMLEIIQANYMPGKIKKILEGQEPTAQFYNKAFGKYGIVIEEGLNTTTQKQMQFAQLLQLREVGVPVPNTVLLDACMIQNKKELIEAIGQSEQQQQQAQQMQMQLQMEEVKARTELAKARAVADEGLGVERYSRVEENKALAEERRAAAIKDEDTAFLNLVKSLKEIDGLDINHIKELLSLSQSIKDQNAHTQEERNKNESQMTAPSPQLIGAV